MITRFVLTAKGSALFAKWQTGTVPQFTKLQIGKGHFSGPDASVATALVTPVKDLAIVGCTSKNNCAYVKADFSNAGITAGFDWTEIGLFATDPTDGEILFGYGYDNTDPTHIPAESESPVSFLFTMTTAIGNASEATATIDPTTIYLTKADLKDYIPGLTAETAIAPDDLFLFHDTSAQEDRKSTLENLAEKIHERPGKPYSATPVKIGKWLETEYSLYKVVIPFPGSSLSESFTAPAQIREIVSVCGAGQHDNNDYWFPIPHASPSASSSMSSFRCTITGNSCLVEVRKGSSITYVNDTVKAIVEFVC